VNTLNHCPGAKSGVVVELSPAEPFGGARVGRSTDSLSLSRGEVARVEGVEDPGGVEDLTGSCRVADFSLSLFWGFLGITGLFGAEEILLLLEVSKLRDLLGFSENFLGLAGEAIVVVAGGCINALSSGIDSDLPRPLGCKEELLIFSGETRSVCVLSSVDFRGLRLPPAINFGPALVSDMVTVPSGSFTTICGLGACCKEEENIIHYFGEQKK